MKRTVQMKTGGVPVAGMRANHFKGWRDSSKKWRAGQPLYVVHPVSRAKKLKKLREWLVAASGTAGQEVEREPSLQPHDVPYLDSPKSNSPRGNGYSKPMPP